MVLFGLLWRKFAGMRQYCHGRTATRTPSPPPVPPHVRLKELQAIPDKLRTDEQWDELNDLEIKLASVNRQGAPMPNAQRPGGGGGPGRDATTSAAAVVGVAGATTTSARSFTAGALVLYNSSRRILKLCVK